MVGVRKSRIKREEGQEALVGGGCAPLPCKGDNEGCQRWIVVGGKRWTTLCNDNESDVTTPFQCLRMVGVGGRRQAVMLVMGSNSLAILRDSLAILRGRQTKKGGHYLRAGTCFIVLYYVLLTYYTLVDRPSAMTPWGIYPGRKILSLTWGLLVTSTRRGLRKDTMVDGWWPRRCRPSCLRQGQLLCHLRRVVHPMHYCLHSVVRPMRRHLQLSCPCLHCHPSYVSLLVFCVLCHIPSSVSSSVVCVFACIIA